MNFSVTKNVHQKYYEVYNLISYIEDVKDYLVILKGRLEHKLLCLRQKGARSATFK